MRLIGLALVLALGLALAPLAAEGQHPTKAARIGYLLTGSLEAAETRRSFEGFHQGLRERGYVEGQDIVIEYRAADGKNERLPGLAAELVGLKVQIIVTRGTPAAVAAKQATSSIPIVMAIATDPVGAGLVTSLGRPGGNVTGLANLDAELSGKRLEILKAAVPALVRVAVLRNPANPAHRTALSETEAAAHTLGVRVQLVDVRNPGEFSTAFSATTTIPIVMVSIADPVGSGLVASLARPGGNITGLAILFPELVGKQLEFLKAVRPTVSRVAVLWNPANPSHALTLRAAQGAAQALGVQLHLEEARVPDVFDRAFAAMTHARVGALLVLGDPMFVQHVRRLVELAAASRLPTMHSTRCREWVEAGGLLCYGASPLDQYRRAATYVDKILKGAKPADLPVEQPTKFELVINLKTAKALGLTIPQSILLRTDQVVE